jgi:hypothetical protein
MFRRRRESSHTRIRTYTRAPTNRMLRILIAGLRLSAGGGGGVVVVVVVVVFVLVAVAAFWTTTVGTDVAAV